MVGVALQVHKNIKSKIIQLKNTNPLLYHLLSINISGKINNCENNKLKLK